MPAPDPTGPPADPAALPDLVAHLRAWADDDPDPRGRAELLALVERADPAEVAAVAEPLRFGTSGMRGPLGIGPAHVNRVTARRLASGLCDHLPERPTVVVGGDGRHGSSAMVDDVAGVVAAVGGTAVCAPAPAPTPLLAFAVRHLGADAGVVVTASHNPRGDNGLKVYLADGIQAVPPVDAEIAGALDRPLGSSLRLAGPGLAGPGLAAPPQFEVLPPAVEGAYRRMAAGLVDPRSRRVRVVHTALHGVSGPLVAAVLDDIGVADLLPVAGQAVVDPDFPSVRSPNPEDPAAMAEALSLAAGEGADVVLAHDPDGDRLAVALPFGDGWRTLSGNELGALLCEHLCRRHAASTSAEERPGVVISTLVSTGLIAAIAAHHGLRHVVTPTGFKWVMRASLDPATRFVFGFEEALGYAVTDAVGDKDGITAAAVVVDLVDRIGAEGAWAVLDDLAARHGVFASRTIARSLTGSEGRRRAAAAMASLRLDPPARLGGEPVVRVVDHRDDGVPSDVVTLELASGGRVHVRPSGTEPKLKVYAEVVVRGAAAGGAVAGGGVSRRERDRQAVEVGRRAATATLDRVLADLDAVVGAGTGDSRSP